MAYLTLLFAAIVALSVTALAQRTGVGPSSANMRLIGHADLMGRTAYQPTLHTIDGRVYLFVGHFAGTTLNGLANGGTTIVDVTDPANPHQVVFIRSDANPPSTGGSQMVRVCEGNGTLGTSGEYYMLRNTSTTHEVWNVTNPTQPKLLSIIKPANGTFTATHKNWWECDTGIAYLVAGQSGPGGDGWTTNQHIKVYDLRNPANPVYVRDIGLVGQNPGSSVKTNTSGVHGPISITTNPANPAERIDRIYVPYGTSDNGVMQILDRLKVLPVSLGGTWDGARPQNPTDDDLRALVIGSMDMTPTEGAHTSFPIFGVPLTHYQGFTSTDSKGNILPAATTRDLVALISEETDNKCTGAPHFGYLVDATRGIGSKAAKSAGENHPMVISTMQVQEDSANPDFCSRGTRFGPHSTNESFYAPYYGKLLFIAYFDGGARVFDIRDPYHPKNVAYFIPNLTANTIPTKVNGVNYLDVSSDNLEVDDRGYIYDVDRVGGGADILELTGCAKQIVERNGSCQQDQGLANPPE